MGKTRCSGSQRPGPHKRPRVLLGASQAWLSRHPPPYEREKHLGRYVNEFAGRHNDRPKDTLEQMRSIVQGMDGKRLPYEELIG